ncbi:MAG: hypothetical protein QW165_04640 [Candidatus Woesearchaeota archaeon]
MDYTGVFDFQLFWFKKFGWLRDGPMRYSVANAEAIADWFNSFKEGNLNNRICVDAGSIAAESLDAVEKMQNKLIVHGSNDSDLEGMLRVRLTPGTLEVVLHPDPRMSYAALCPKYDVLEVDMGAWKKDKSQRCVLFYPHGSLLMMQEHKTAALSNLGIYYEPPGSSVVPELFENAWKEAIVQRVKSRVLSRLKTHYASISLYGVEFDDVAPCEGGKGNGIGTSNVVFTFYVERSKGMKSRNLVFWVQEFFKKELPFYAQVWCMPAGKPRHSKLSVLVELPE